MIFMLIISTEARILKLPEFSGGSRISKKGLNSKGWGVKLIVWPIFFPKAA